MDSCPFSLKRPLLLVAAVLAVSSAGAKPAATNAWQSIIFSSPTNSDASSNLDSSFPDQPSSSSDLQNRLQMYQDSSPVTFHGSPVPGLAPMPRPVVRVHKSSNDNPEWEFMTPAQIMGVAPDQILQSQERKADSDQSGLTPIERMLLGRNPVSNLRAAVAENKTPSAMQSVWSDMNDNKKGIMADLINSSLGNLQSDAYGSTANDAGNDNPFAGPAENSSWSKLFGVPAASPAPDVAQQLRQQEDMKRFMQLLNPRSAVATETTASADDTALPQTATSFPNFDSTTPVANPLGDSFAPLTGSAPLTTGIGQPASLAPLPAVTPQPNNQSAAKPAWAPQPAPWLSPTPQPFVVPQRKF